MIYNISISAYSRNTGLSTLRGRENDYLYISFEKYFRLF